MRFHPCSPASLALPLLVGACGTTPAPSGGPSPSTTTITSTGAVSGQAGTPVEITRHESTRGAAATFAASPEAVWAALPGAYEELGLEVGTVDVENRVFGARRLRVRSKLAGESLSRFVNCGNEPFGGATADAQPLELSVLSTLRPGAGGTVVETRVGGVARRPASGSSSECRSTGVLEGRIATAIAERVGS